MTLLRCRKQGLVDARVRKRGRVREYIYTITERGRKRLEYYFATGSEVDWVRVDLDAIVKSAENDADPLMLLGSWSFSNANSICSDTWQTDVFSNAKQIERLSTALLKSRPEFVIAFAAQRVLSQIRPSTLKRITDLTHESPKGGLYSRVMKDTESKLEGIGRSEPPIIEDLVNLAIIKLHDMNLGQYILYCMWKDEKGEKERYKRLYDARAEKSDPENAQLAAPIPIP
ncbi:MAG: hypothetical protein JSV57_00475 [Candidatus Bathyarchaeota archaeon]|nr:MAG: hypothetical protein JSV57_00475 [Candidatus Bathyarchaeota archaeon]